MTGRPQSPARGTSLMSTGNVRENSLYENLSRIKLMATKTAAAGPSLSDTKLFRQANYIDGAWVDARGGATIDVDNPATGDVIGSVPRFGRAETRTAIDAAARALPAWRGKTA